MNIKEIADRLYRKYDTRSPFDLAASLGIIVLYESLGDIQGYHNSCFGHKFIHINHSLSAYDATFTCAHELGHALLHPGINTPFLRKHTMFSVDKIETQANRFALAFLYDDTELNHFLGRSLADVAAYMRVDTRLAEYRMKSVAIARIEQLKIVRK